jgi:hypothetical protein
MIILDESLKVNSVNSPFIKTDHPRWRMKEVGRSKLSFTLDELYWTSHRNVTACCSAVNKVLLLFAVWLFLLLSLKYRLWFSYGQTFFFCSFFFNNFFYLNWLNNHKQRYLNAWVQFLLFWNELSCSILMNHVNRISFIHWIHFGWSIHDDHPGWPI